MSDIKREANGHFQKGESANPAGRPSKARELAYLAILRETVTLETWRAIVAKAIEDALRGKDWAARDRARRFIAEYAIGKPPQTLRLQSETDTFDEFDHLSDDELRALVADAERGAGGAGAAKKRKK